MHKDIEKILYSEKDIENIINMLDGKVAVYIGLKGGVPVNSKKKGMTLATKQKAAGWIFLAPASIMIAIMSFYPMIRAFIISLQTGAGANMRFADPI